MEIKLKFVRKKDMKMWEWWNRRWDLCGEIDPMVTDRLELVAEIDGVEMSAEWTANAIKQAKDCHCGACEQCSLAEEAKELALLPAA